MFSETKAAVRRRVRTRTRALSPQFRGRASAAICSRLSRLRQLAWTRSLLVFVPLKDEPDITPFLRRLIKSGRTLWAPAFDAGAGQTNVPLRWRRLHTLEELEPGYRGFRQPKSPSEVPPPNGLVLVPGVAFTRGGDRLGRGGGHYDRFLAGHVGFRVGVCFGFQVVSALPTQPHDEAVDVVLTESAVHARLPGSK